MSRSKLHNPGRAIQLTLGSLELEAYSISGLASFVAVPSFDACFDLGHCTVAASQLRKVLLSHVHQDHCLGVIRHLSLRQMTNQKPSRIYVPAESRDALIDVLKAFHTLEQKPPIDYEPSVIGVGIGDEFALSPTRSVKAFDVTHRIESRGYTVFENRRKLRQQYQGLPGEQIQQARQRGEELYDYHTVNLLTYIGDSTIETLEDNPQIGQSEVLFIEATHLPGTPVTTSAKFGHTHLDEIIDLYRRKPDTLASNHIIIKHFSMKYSPQDIHDAYKTLPKSLRERVTMLLLPKR